ncbi:MAG: copper resistance CopC family protein [Actinomycetes bacterium]
MNTAHRHLLLAVIGGAFMVLGFATTANAHSDLEASTPKANSKVGTSPTSVSLTFNEDIGAKGNGVVVTNAAGDRFDTGALVIAGSNAKQSIKKLTVPGRYTVRYRIVSADGHVVSSKYSFTFAPSSSSAPSSTPVAATTNQKSTGNGAVVGGAIVGGIAGGLTGVYLVRRKRSKSAT